MRSQGQLAAGLALFIAACTHHDSPSPTDAKGPQPLAVKDPGADPEGPKPLPPAAPITRPTPLAPVLVPMAPDATTYDIDQAIDDRSGTFAGKAIITYTNTTGAPLTSLPLLLHPNAGAELGVPNSETGSIAITEVRTMGGPKAVMVPTRRTLIMVRFAAPIPAKSKVILSVRFSGKLRQLGADANDMMSQTMSSMASMAGGNHVADYGLLAVGDGIVTAASAYPMVAPYREGSFDTTPPPRFGDLAYNSVAGFHVRTSVPSGLRVVTNLVDGVPVAAANGQDIVTSDGGNVRDLVLVASRDFESASAAQGSTRVTSWYRARDAKAGRSVLTFGTAALASLTRRFGPYPWPELHLAEATIVGGAGGVEFCGAALVAGMFYRPPDPSKGPLGPLAGLLGGGGLEGALGDDDGAPAAAPNGALDAAMGDTLEFIVAHEVAHQYFAGLVGNDSRRYAALDEPLAQYAAALVIEDSHGAAAGARAFDKNVKLSYALHRVMGGADHEAARDTHQYRTPTEYAGLIYGKSPYAYVALRRAMGDERLDAAIRGAIVQTRFRLVTLDEWIAALEANAGSARTTISPLFHRYLHEAHGDQDLGVDDSGDFVMAHMLPDGMGSGLADGMKAMGMKPKDFFKMLLGGGAAPGASAAPPAQGIDPEGALKALESLGN